MALSKLVNHYGWLITIINLIKSGKFKFARFTRVNDGLGLQFAHLYGNNYTFYTF